MTRILTSLLLLAILLTACGGSESAENPTSSISPTTESSVDAAPTAVPTPAEDADDAEDFPPGTRLSTIDPLAAGGENNLVMLANQGDALVVGAESTAGQDIALGLFLITESGQDQLAAQVNAGPGYEALVHTFSVAGAYRLAILDLSGVDGGYALRMASSPGVALYVAPQHEVEGKLEDNDSLSYLHNGYAGREARFTVTPSSADLDLSVSIVSLRDFSTIILSVDEGGPGEPEIAALVAPADDEYLITVERVSGGTGTFSLTLAED